MKNFAIVFCLSLLFNNLMLAQDFTLSWQDEPIGDEETVYGSASDSELVFYANLTNNTSDSVSVRVERVFIDLQEGTLHQLCWGNCFPANFDSSFVSPLIVKIGPGETTLDLTFSGHYRPQGVYGNSIVQYTFFNVSDPGENVSVEVTYTASTSTIDSDLLREETIVSLYPNPSRDWVLIELPVESFRVQLVDFSGKILFEKTSSGNLLELDIIGFIPGIYGVRIYLSDNRSFCRKLVIE